MKTQAVKRSQPLLWRPIEANAVDDKQLLSKFATEGSHEAFEEITRRYSTMVYSACLRVLGNVQMAEDATQGVFLVLARRAPKLLNVENLSGWLFITAQNLARESRRNAERRLKHEREAVSTMRDETTPANNSVWEAIRPQLNAALSRLPTPQRDAVVARYLCGLSEAEAATRLSCPLNTLHSRVKLGLEKLRMHLRPVMGGTTAMALGTLLLENGTELVPAHLAAKVSGACLIKGAATAEALAAANGVLKAAAISKAATLVACTVLVLGSATAYVSLHRFVAGPVSVLFQEDFEKTNLEKWEGERQPDPLNGANHVIKAGPISQKYGEGQFFLVARMPWDEKGWEARADTYVRFRYFARKFSTQQGLKLQGKRSDGVNFGGFMTKITNDQWETVTAHLRDLVLVNDPKQPMPEKEILHQLAWCIYTKGAVPDGAEFYVDDVTVFRTADEIPVAKFQAMSE